MTVVSNQKKSYMAHETAVIDSGAVLGEGVQVWHFSHIMPGAKIGADSKLGQNVFVDQNVTIGKRVKIQNNVSVYRCVMISDDVFVGPSVVFTNVLKPRSEFPKKIEEYHKTFVAKGATLGANSTIVCGVKIGEYAFIGAGSVVTRDVPAHALVTGVPARLRGWMCVCGSKLQSVPAKSRKKIKCPACSKAYAVSASGCKTL